MSSTDGKAFWVEDRYAARCYMCNQLFNWIRRRHHCRQCGQIFCGDCLEAVAVLPTDSRISADSKGSQSIGRGLVAFLGLQRDEKVCRNCLRQRKGRLLTAVNAGVGPNSSAVVALRRDATMHNIARMRSASHVEAPSSHSQFHRSEGNATPTGFHVEVHPSSGRNSPLASSGREGGLPSPELTFTSSAGKLTSLVNVRSTSNTPVGSPVAARSTDCFPRVSSIAASPREGGAVSFGGEKFTPHTETPRERLITYGLQELPMVEPNTMEQWLTQTLNKARRLKVAVAPTLSYGALPLVQRKKRQFLANPRAKFRTGERVPEAGLFSTAFLDSGSFEAKTGILELLEARCTTHLLRRVRWLIHEANLQHQLTERVRLFHEARLSNKSQQQQLEASSSTATEDPLSLVRKPSVVSLKAPAPRPQRAQAGLNSPRGSTLRQEAAVVTAAALSECEIADVLPPQDWLEATCDISWRVVSQTSCEREPNVRDHIDILTLPGGDFADTEIIPGIAFFHNIASKRMRSRIDSPRILLLGGDVGLHMAVTELRHTAAPSGGGANAPPTPGGHALPQLGGAVVVPAIEFLEYTNTYPGSLEKQYQRIQVWKPTLIIAEGGVHHYLKDRMLKDANQITLLTNVGKTMLERIAVCTGAQIINDLQSVSIAELQEASRFSPLGYCTSFQVTLPEPLTPCVMLSGLPRPSFTSILLRGASATTLDAAKDLLQQSILAAHHLALETHYLVDFCALLAQEHHEYRDAERLVVEGITHSSSSVAVDLRNAETADRAQSPWRREESSLNASLTGGPAAKADTSEGSPRGAVLPTESLSLNMGITFPKDVLSCCGSTDAIRQHPEQYGLQNEFTRVVRMMRDSIVVQTIFIDGPGATHCDAAAAASPTPAAPAAGNNANASTAAGGTTSGVHQPSSTTSNNSDAHLSPAAAPQVEASETVRKLRHVYPFYQDGDETLYEFLVERATESRDSCRHILHGSSRIIVRCTVEMKDVFEDVVAQDTRTPPSSGGAGLLSSTTAFGARVAEQLAELYLKQLNVTARFVRVPHCYTTCKECAKGRFSTPSTAPIPVSPHTLSMSFGAFLEISAYMTKGCIAMCGHSLHLHIMRSFVLYPTEGMQVTVTFEVEPLPVYKVHGPPLQLRPLLPVTVEFTPPAAMLSLLFADQSTTRGVASISQVKPLASSSLAARDSPPKHQGSISHNGSAVDQANAAVSFVVGTPLSPKLLAPSRTDAGFASPEAQPPRAAGAEAVPTKSVMECRSARQLYVARELEELAVNLTELVLLRATKRNAAAAANTRSTSVIGSQVDPSSPSSPSPFDSATRLEKLVVSFADLATLNQVTHFRLTQLNPYIDEVLLDKGSPLAGPAAAADAYNRKSVGAQALSVAELAKLRCANWAYLPNEQMAFRLNEPTSIIAAVLLASQRGLKRDEPPHPSDAFPTRHERSHTRTFSVGGADAEVGKPSRMSKYISQFSTAVSGLKPVGAAGRRDESAPSAASDQAPPVVSPAQQPLLRPSSQTDMSQSVDVPTLMQALGGEGAIQGDCLPDSDSPTSSLHMFPTPVDDIAQSDMPIHPPCRDDVELRSAVAPEEATSSLLQEPCSSLQPVPTCDYDPLGATTIEELFQQVHVSGSVRLTDRTPVPPEETAAPDVSADQSAHSLPHQPAAASTSTHQFLEFAREDEAIDVLAGKSVNGPSPSSYKYVMQDIVMASEAAKPHSISVEVMYPHQFAAMRYLYARDAFSHHDSPSDAGTDDGVLDSLLRCRPFNAQGGKSKSDFFVTLDDRLMLKRIKLTELKHFLQFAPSYFGQMVQLFTHVQHQRRRGRQQERRCSFGEDSDDDDDGDACGDFSKYSSTMAEDCAPSALAKIFGVFSIHFKRGKKRFGDSGDMRYFMLMENLTFRRPVEISFDLKGSQRKRHAAEGSTVLLDQDLVKETKRGFFFFCKESTRTWVLESLAKDAALLCAAEIMDYSAIVAVDAKTEGLSLGIIDYLHPYTGAKVIESKFKGGIENVFGQGRDPTIIEPPQYKQRFLRWMDSYFCAVPDKVAPLKKRLATVSSGWCTTPKDGAAVDSAMRNPMLWMLSEGLLVHVDGSDYKVL